VEPQDVPTAAGPCLLARTAAVVATGCAVLHWSTLVIPV
jgi:hypothetical protein